jgi:hypothetical protein
MSLATNEKILMRIEELLRTLVILLDPQVVLTEQYKKVDKIK